MITPNELREKLNEEQVIHIMSTLGATEYIDNGDYLTFRTICHNEYEEDGGANLSYYKGSKLFHCFSECGETFNIFTMVQKRLEITSAYTDVHFTDAFYYVLNHSEESLSGKIETASYEAMAERYAAQPIEGFLEKKDERVLEAFFTYLPIEWERDNISLEAMKKYSVKFSPSRNAVVIPHFDIHGNLIGIRNRPLDPEVTEKYGKYLPMYINNELYNHPLSMNLYGLNIVKDEIRRTGLAIIAESEKACMQAYDMYGENNVVVASCGNRINRWQILLLKKYCDVKEVILAFDREEREGERKYFDKLMQMSKSYSEYCNFSFIYNNKLLKLKENIFDAGKEVGSELIKRRVRV